MKIIKKTLFVRYNNIYIYIQYTVNNKDKKTNEILKTRTSAKYLKLNNKCDREIYQYLLF
jgi:hypothetical protein